MRVCIFRKDILRVGPSGWLGPETFIAATLTYRTAYNLLFEHLKYTVPSTATARRRLDRAPHAERPAGVSVAIDAEERAGGGSRVDVVVDGHGRGELDGGAGVSGVAPSRVAVGIRTVEPAVGGAENDVPG